MHDERRIRIRIHTSDEWIRIREAQKHVDPVDPDPDSEHRFGQYSLASYLSDQQARASYWLEEFANFMLQHKTDHLLSFAASSCLG